LVSLYDLTLTCSTSDEDNYALDDKAGERKYGMVLDEAVEKARELKGGLFSKKMFYVTPKVAVDIKLLKSVVTACGGQVSHPSRFLMYFLIFSPWVQITTNTPTPRIISSNSNRHVVSCAEDVSIWRPIAKKHPIYTHELILTSALRQEIEWENEEFRVAGSSDNLE
jgi:mediator of DNA damage checkpoint protein 1